MLIAKTSGVSQPFRFYTRLHLRELTGWKAKNLKEFVDYLKIAPDSIIYHHTHHYLQEHQYLSPEPPNDFAYWVRVALNENELAEKLASINIIEFLNLHDLRDKIISTVEKFIENSKGKIREANKGQEFHFLKSISFILPTPYAANSLEEFATILKKVTIHSLYFHMFEARLRQGRITNDFSLWMETSLGEKELAKKIAKFDPYTYTMEGLRAKIIQFIETRLKEVASCNV